MARIWVIMGPVLENIAANGKGARAKAPAPLRIKAYFCQDLISSS